MTTSDTELTRVLELYAYDVTAGPDVHRLVEARYLHRRRLRLTGSVAGVVMAMVGVVAGIAALLPAPAPSGVGSSPRPSAVCSSGPRLCGFIGLRQPPSFTPGFWKAPPDPVPPAGKTWPAATFHFPKTVPGGEYALPMGSIDATHVLVASWSGYESTDAFYSYDTGSGAFRLIARMPEGKPISPDRWVVSDHFLVWSEDQPSGPDASPDRFDVSVVPLSGGTPRLIAQVRGLVSQETSTWYATDTTVYWSDDKDGVVALPLAGGTPAPAPGFAGMHLLDGSDWAVRSALVDGNFRVDKELKQLGTGRTLQVATSPDMQQLQCTPTFCMGEYGNSMPLFSRQFIQELDGGHRMAMPDAFQGAWRVHVLGDTSYLSTQVDEGDTTIFQVWNPTTGSAGSLAATGNAQGETSAYSPDLYTNMNNLFGVEDGKTGIWTYLALRGIP